MGHVRVAPEGDLANAKIVIVGVAPGATEERMGRPFIGPSGKILFENLTPLGVTRGDCYITNLAKCRTGPKDEGGDLEPDAITRKHCVKQYAQEWAEMKSKVVLLFGVLPIRQFVGKASSVVRGRVIEKDEITYLPLWHPAYVARNRSSIYTWRKDMAVIPSLIGKGERVIKRVRFDLVESPYRVPFWLTTFKGRGEARPIAIDLETTTKTPFEPDARILSIAISDAEDTCVIDWESIWGLGTVSLEMREFLEGNTPKIAQNAKFEFVWLLVKHGVRLNRVVFDPSVAKYLLDEGTGTSVGLKQMVWQYLPDYGGYEKGIDYENMGNVSKPNVWQLNATDAFVSAKLYEILRPRIDRKGLGTLYDEVLMPGSVALAEIEANGMALDLPLVRLRSRELELDIAQKKSEILTLPEVQKIPGFKIDSPFSLRKLFFEGLRYDPRHFTPKGLPSIDKDTFEELSHSDPYAKQIMDYRSLMKIKGTYYDNYIEMSDANGKIHPSYNITASKGGRPAAGRPNIQNVPPEVKKCFISRFGAAGRLVKMDFRHIEMRVMAIESEDPELLRIFKEGRDPHRETAVTIYMKDLKDVTFEDRRSAKTVNFGLFYGMSAGALADREGWSIRKALAFYERFFQRFGGVRRWMDRQRGRAERGMEIVSLFGRRWDLSGYTGEDRAKRAFNFPIQSAAVDINIFTLGELAELMKMMELESKIIAEVHDENLVDAPNYNEEMTVISLMREIVKGLPEVFPWMLVPMEIETMAGRNWGEMIEVPDA
jgi:DNA polymerase-1